jgi:hypothetical protein
MARVPQELCNEGSQKWLQILVNRRSELIDRLILERSGLKSGSKIEWLSPLEADDYAEYCDQEFLERLGIGTLKRPLHDFWPNQGPHWDALARTDRGDLILVEAKAHIPEMESNPTGAKGHSLVKIRRSLESVKLFYGIDSDIDWCEKYYQYANRIAHLYFLRELNGLPAHLFFLYFVGDEDMKGPAMESEWRDVIGTVHRTLGIEGTVLSDSLIDVFVNVHSLEDVPARQ